MKFKYLLIFIPAILLSCKPKESINNQLIGRWTMYKVYESDKDVTAEHNPKGNRWIKFNEDGSFESDGDPFGKNKGRWKVDDKQSILYIDSDVDDDDSEWHISFKENKTIWRGIGTPRKENFKLVHKRQGDF